MKPEEDKITCREKLLCEIGKDKSVIALSPEEVREIDHQLSSDWGIKYYPTGSELFGILEGLKDQDAVDLFHDAYVNAAGELANPSRTSDDDQEAKIYDIIAHPELLGPVTSQRRHIIIDAITMSIGLGRHLGLTGRILDVGCHAGFVTHFLSERLRCPAVGIDPSEPAIEFARRYNRPRSAAEFFQAKLPWETPDRFDMVVAIDSMPGSEDGTRRFLAGVGELLQPGGFAIVASPDWIPADKNTRKYLSRAVLGFGYADVVGGFGCIPPKFEATPLLVLLKGGHNKLPLGNLRSLAESEWPYFRGYANASETAMSEKTQAFERALRKSLAPNRRA